MRVIAIWNLERSVGKTIAALALAENLATRRERRILLIDADSQGKLTALLHGNPHDGNLMEVLTAADGAYGVSAIQPTFNKRVDLLCGSDSLMDLDMNCMVKEQYRPTALGEMITHLIEKDKEYDYVLIDCPPAFNMAAKAVLQAANEIIIPVRLPGFSLNSMGNLVRQVSNIQRVNPSVRLLGCLPTMYSQEKKCQKALEILQINDLPVFKSKIWQVQTKKKTSIENSLILENAATVYKDCYKLMKEVDSEAVFVATEPLFVKGNA